MKRRRPTYAREGFRVLAFIDDALYASFVATFGESDRPQWPAGAEALLLGITVSFRCGYFISDTKCDIYPSQVQKYLGIICGSTPASFRVPEDKLRKLGTLIKQALAAGSTSVAPVGENRGEVHEHVSRHPPRVPLDPLHVRGNQQSPGCGDPAQHAPGPLRRAS